ncbi:MAG: hypothetical protein QGM48_03690 [Actinomycetota bacterium]|nr:hypothetical protein [Actinomycetota bacterium]
MTRKHTHTAGEEGMVIVMAAILMVTIIMLLALVVDLGLLRMDRRTDRLAADAAATAGVASLDPFVGGDAEEACSVAWAYFKLNVPDEGPTSTPPDCNVFAGACNPDVVRTTKVSAGPYTVEIVQPVPDDHAFMGGQAVNPDIDGGACQRLGVGINRQRDYAFASVAGIDSGETNVSAVARIGAGLGAGELVPLLVLEPISCDSLYTSGQGKITVSYFGDTPGIIVVDSDASKMTNPNRCSSNSWSIDSKGTKNGWIRAIPVPGQGISSAILSYALSGAVGANPESAYDPSDLTDPIDPDEISDPLEPEVSWFRLYPRPIPASRRITRAPIDWRYNCKASYPDYDLDGPGSGGLPIMGCPEAATRLPYIDNLRMAYGDASDIGTPPAGIFERWTDMHACAYQPSDPDVIVEGNWWIDCPGGFVINNNVTFIGGSIIADGPIEVKGGSLTINPESTWRVDEILHIRSGRLYKVAQASITMEQTFVYLDDGWIEFGGGDGALIWTAPIGGTSNSTASNFEDLVLWSESRAVHKLGGQAGNQLEGTLFTPNADPFVLTGQAGQFQTAAQFLTRRLEVGGLGEVRMHPDPDRITLIPVRDIRLIR